jgi:hypothetical protein
MYTDLDKKRDRERVYGKIYKARKIEQEKLRRETNIRRIAAAIVAVELSQKQE